MNRIAATGLEQSFISATLSLNTRSHYFYSFEDYATNLSQAKSCFPTIPRWKVDVNQYSHLEYCTVRSCSLQEFRSSLCRLVLHSERHVQTTKNIPVRFIMGMCEGSITAGFMIVTSMFYTRAEQSQRVGYWCKLNQ